jgi:hypothetical protein
MKFTLQPLEEIDIPQHGQTVVYLGGTGELLFQAEEGSFQIPPQTQVTLKNVFNSIRVKNMGSIVAEFEILLVTGEFERLSDVSIVQIAGITNAITANVATMPAVEVATMPAVEVSAMPAVEVSTMPAVKVSEMPAVVSKDISNVITTVYIVPPESSVNIPALTNRKRLVIQGYSADEEAIFCRVSDSSKVTVSGQFLVCGGGLLAEVEHKHAAALKVWNPSNSESVEVVTMEEF